MPHPSLFVICTEIEILCRMLKAGEDNFRIRGISLSSTLDPISHLFFADDLLFFAEAKPLYCSNLIDTLSRWCFAAGQTVNALKSRVMFSRRLVQTTRDRVLQIQGFPAP